MTPARTATFIKEKQKNLYTDAQSSLRFRDLKTAWRASSINFLYTQLKTTSVAFPYLATAGISSVLPDF